MSREGLDQAERGVSTPSEDGYLKRMCLHNCHANAPNLKVESGYAYDVNISSQMVQRLVAYEVYMPIAPRKRL